MLGLAVSFPSNICFVRFFFIWRPPWTPQGFFLEVLLPSRSNFWWKCKLQAKACRCWSEESMFNWDVLGCEDSVISGVDTVSDRWGTRRPFEEPFILVRAVCQGLKARNVEFMRKTRSILFHDLQGKKRYGDVVSHLLTTLWWRVSLSEQVYTSGDGNIRSASKSSTSRSRLVLWGSWALR